MSVVDKAVSILCEHFEVVEVGVSWHDLGGTHVLHHGAGNLLARQGLVEHMADANSDEPFCDKEGAGAPD
jgi:hypothetical protein